MKLTIDQVKKVAKLANLPLSGEDEQIYTGQLTKILEYIDLLGKVDASDINPTYNVSANTNITREDISGNSLTQEESLQNAPKEKNGFFVTKGVFEQE